MTTKSDPKPEVVTTDRVRRIFNPYRGKATAELESSECGRVKRCRAVLGRVEDPAPRRHNQNVRLSDI